MARSGMSTLIEQVRGLTNAGTADYTEGTSNYWDADQIQVVLDRHRHDHWAVPLSPQLSYTAAGAVQYLDYPLPMTHLEETTGGTAVFILATGSNVPIGTASYTADYTNGYVTFTSDQAGSAVMITCREYDLYGAVAEIWRMKSSQFVEQFDFSTDNTSVKLSQKMQQAEMMAQTFEKKSKWGGVTVGKLVRGDMNDVN